MDKWEYIVRYYNSSTKFFSTYLNEYGEKGWELVSAIPDGVTDYKCIFKRKIKENGR